MSAPNRRLVVAPGARADLRDILRYTTRRWGTHQRAIYKARLEDAMHGLLIHPYRGQSRDDLSPGLQALPVTSHLIFYRIGEREVTIVRILHGAMDHSSIFN
jgi:toxin ParE1/3/4